jgi:hypothetical protein
LILFLYARNGFHSFRSDRRVLSWISPFSSALESSLSRPAQFSAKLRGSTRASDALKDILMHLVLRVLGLAHIKDNLVGSGELRGISGAARLGFGWSVDGVSCK